MNTRRAAGFSLLELLVVAGVIAVLIAIASPAVVSLRGSMAINGAGQKLVGALRNARQDAMARSVPVEVRFYWGGRDFDPTPRWSSWGTFYVRTSGTAERLDARGKREWFDAGIVLSPQTEPHPLSTLLTGTNAIAPRAGEETIRGEKVTYSAFRFFPDGSTDLPAEIGGQRVLWHATAVREQDAGRARPDNFLTVRVDRMNGAVTVYRP